MTLGNFAPNLIIITGGNFDPGVGILKGLCAFAQGIFLFFRELPQGGGEYYEFMAMFHFLVKHIILRF